MPDWKKEIQQRLEPVRLAPMREAAIIEELAQALEDCYAELIAGGAAEAEAYQQTRAELEGSQLLLRELQHVERQPHRETVVLGSIRRRNVIADVWQDLWFGSRMLAKQPGFTLVAVITLALGIGANTAIFSVVYSLLLRPLPYPAAERLVVLATTSTELDFRAGVSYPDFLDWRERTHSLDDTACFLNTNFNLTGVDPAVAVPGRRTTWNFFQILGVKPQLGRLFAAADDQAEAVPTAVISDGLWREKFGGDNAIIGRTIALDGNPFTVIGVLPPRFELLRRDRNLRAVGALVYTARQPVQACESISTIRSGASQRRRYVGASSRRPLRGCGATRARIPGNQSRATRSRRQTGRFASQRCASGAVGFARRGRLRVAHCLFECSESDARACRRTRT
jgi:hypothetical protein